MVFFSRPFCRSEKAQLQSTAAGLSVGNTGEIQKGTALRRIHGFRGQAAADTCGDFLMMIEPSSLVDQAGPNLDDDKHSCRIDAKPPGAVSPSLREARLDGGLASPGTATDLPKRSTPQSAAQTTS